MEESKERYVNKIGKGRVWHKKHHKGDLSTYENLSFTPSHIVKRHSEFLSKISSTW